MCSANLPLCAWLHTESKRERESNFFGSVLLIAPTHHNYAQDIPSEERFLQQQQQPAQWACLPSLAGRRACSKNFLLDSIVGFPIRFDKWQIRKCTETIKSEQKEQKKFNHPSCPLDTCVIALANITNITMCVCAYYNLWELCCCCLTSLFLGI